MTGAEAPLGDDGSGGGTEQRVYSSPSSSVTVSTSPHPVQLPPSPMRRANSWQSGQRRSAARRWPQPGHSSTPVEVREVRGGSAGSGAAVGREAARRSREAAGRDAEPQKRRARPERSAAPQRWQDGVTLAYGPGQGPGVGPATVPVGRSGTAGQLG